MQQGKVYQIPNYLLKDQNKFIQFIEKIKTDLQFFFNKNFYINTFTGLANAFKSNPIQVPYKPTSKQELRICTVKAWEKGVYQRIGVIGENEAE